MIATSGVEKVVKLWSALPLPQARHNSRESGRNRQVYSHDEYIRLVMRSDSLVSHDYSNQSVEENPQMMAFFDSLLQREIEGFEGSNSSSSSSSGEDANDEEEYSQTVVEPEEDEEDQNLGSGSGGNVESENEDRLDSEIERRERVLQRISLNVADGLLSSDVGARHRVRVVEEVSILLFIWIVLFLIQIFNRAYLFRLEVLQILFQELRKPRLLLRILRTCLLYTSPSPRDS